MESTPMGRGSDLPRILGIFKNDPTWRSVKNDLQRLDFDPHSIKCLFYQPKLRPGNQSMDVVLVLDGTPKSEQKGFAAEINAANLFIDAFTGEGITAKPNFAVVHYSGPRTWSGVSVCTGKNSKKVDMEKQCHVKIAQHFSDDLTAVKGTVNGPPPHFVALLNAVMVILVQPIPNANRDRESCRLAHHQTSCFRESPTLTSSVITYMSVGCASLLQPNDFLNHSFDVGPCCQLLEHWLD